MKDLKWMTGLSFMLTLLLFNCNTPSNLLQDGDYDEAVIKAVKNLRKNKKKKEKDIIVVEDAFRKITSRDMREIEALEAEGQARNWVKINELHNDIKDRQDLIYPYLPLIATKTHYKADFRFVQIVPLEIESRKKAAAYYYEAGKDQLNAAIAHGDKQSARSAHLKFAKVKNYFDNFAENNALLNQAYEMGLDKVILEMRNSSFAFIPIGFEDQLLAFNERNLDNQWTHYYKPHNAPTDIDYKVIIDITDIDVSPEHIREDRYQRTKELTRTEQREVKEKFKGQIVNTEGDSVLLTKTVIEDVEVPFTVQARVVDVYQSKSAFVQARVSFYETNGKTLLDSDIVNATIDFENISTTFRGDRRALNNEVLSRLGGSPVQFPTDSELVYEAAAQLKGNITDTIRGTAQYALR